MPPARPKARGRGGTIVQKPLAQWGDLVCVLTLVTVLAGCSIPFGNGGDPSYQSPEERRREGSRLYKEEQQNLERERQFDRVGPPSDR
jgi:hypothetical protein